MDIEPSPDLGEGFFVLAGVVGEGIGTDGIEMDKRQGLPDGRNLDFYFIYLFAAVLPFPLPNYRADHILFALEGRRNLFFVGASSILTVGFRLLFTC